MLPFFCFLIFSSAKDETEAIDFGRKIMDDFEKQSNTLLDAVFAAKLI